MTRLLIVAVLSAAAFAQEAKTEAESLFEKAWWEETASGALDKALEGYRKAADATGPAAIRARSLYRAAIVEQRLGRTDMAVALLERLAKDFPGETDLLKEAKSRLQEWTAVDLRKSFSEWYRSYVFSPEFQARVVDLVLRLGSGKPEDSQEASNQLLTIGQASVPALQESLKSSNTLLRIRATQLLLQLGVVPPTEALTESFEWTKAPESWLTLYRADEGTRRRVREEVKGDAPVIRAIRAVVTSPEEMLAYVRSESDRSASYQVLGLLFGQCGDAMRKQVVGLLSDPDVPEPVTSFLLGKYAQVDVDLPSCLDWARTLPNERARGVAVYWAASKLTEKSEEDLDAVLAFVPDPDAVISPVGLLVLSALRAQPRLGAFAWTPARLGPLVDLSMHLEEKRPRSGEISSATSVLSPVLRAILAQAQGASALADALLDRAAHMRKSEALNWNFPEVTSLLSSDWPFSTAEGDRRSWLELFVKRLTARWPEAPLQDKVALLELAATSPALGNNIRQGMGGTLAREATARGTDPELQTAIVSLIGRVAVADLLDPFDLSKPEDARSAVETLGRLQNRLSRDQETISSMREILIHGTSPTRRLALALLRAWKSQDDVSLLPAAKEVVSDEEPEVRLWAVNRLSEWNSFDASPYLVKALGDSDADIRAAAAGGLARVGREDAVPALIKLLDDANPAVREAALAALEQIRKIVELKKTWQLEQAGFR